MARTKKTDTQDTNDTKNTACEEKNSPHWNEKHLDADWAAIQMEFSAGRLSVDQIAEKFGVPRTTLFRRAQKNGWNRGLAKKISGLAADKIVESIVEEAEETPTPEDEALFVERGAEFLASVNRKHRNTLMRLQGMTMKMLEELADPAIDLDLLKRAQVLDKLGGTIERTIKLERQALGMDAHQTTDVFEGKGIKIEFVSPSGQS